MEADSSAARGPQSSARPPIEESRPTSGMVWLPGLHNRACISVAEPKV